MVEQLIEDVAHSLGSWAYLLVAFMATAETAAFLGFIAPGEFTIILGGVLAGEGTLSVELLIGVVWASIVVGDSIGFLIGHRLGRNFAIRHGHRVRLTEERIRRVEQYFARHGGKTIFFGRWVGFVRPLMPFTAGASGMRYQRFLPYDILSAGLFGSFFTLLGYIFWRNFEEVVATVGRGAIGFGTLVALVILGVIAFKRLRDPEERRRLAERLDRLGRRPAFRPIAALVRAIGTVVRPVTRTLVLPVARRLGPPLRFLGQRLTPGGLGIELTTLLAIAAVAGYVFGIYTSIVSHDLLGRTPADGVAIDAARDSESGLLEAIARAIDVLGSWPLVLAIVAVAATVFAVRRRRVDALVLAIGFGLTQAGVYITKGAVERPRPPDPLVDVGSSSFPSGHSATATTFIALAVLVTRATGGIPRRVALVVAAAVLAVAVAGTRVYLRAHYLSDVTAGLALGLATFAVCGSVALVVSYLRNNYRRAGDRNAVEGAAPKSQAPAEALTTSSDR